jgi:hypothetical protein
MWKICTQAEQISNTTDVYRMILYIHRHHTAQRVQNVEELDHISVKYMTY